MALNMSCFIEFDFLVILVIMLINFVFPEHVSRIYMKTKFDLNKRFYLN